MRRKIVATTLIVTILMVSILSACGGSDASKIVGQWERQNTEEVSAPFDKLEFFSDYTYSSDDANYDGNYSIDGSRIKFSGILVSPITCSFDVSGKNLILTSEDKTWKFVKVK